MLIDLSKITHNPLYIDEKITLDKELYQNASILDIKEIHLTGEIVYDYEDNLALNLLAKGTFILKDSLTLEPLDYPFSCEIEEIIEGNELKNPKFYEKSKNTLDISEILWENIVLEIPISATNHTVEEIKACGDGWELLKENDEKIDPRLAKLKELLDEGKE